MTMKRKMHIVVGETKLETYTRDKSLALMEEKQISVYKLAKNCENMSTSGIYKCLNGEHKPGLQFLEALCKLAGLTVTEFFADFEKYCNFDATEKAAAAAESKWDSKVQKGEKDYEGINQG